MPSDPMALLEAIGLRPVIIDWLDDKAVVVASCKTILIGPHADLDQVTDHVLARALGRLSAQQP